MEKLENRSPLGIYVHIPFCVRRCPYCGFYSTEIGDGSHVRKNCAHENHPLYFAILKEELRERAEGLTGKYYVDSIYFGGGTPSLSEPGDIKGVIDGISSCFDIASDCEISMEANPGTLGTENLKGFREAGVNRLSIGLQSFDEEVLKTLGRIHSADDFVKSYDLARDTGFDNINVDLMFGIPGMSMGKWTSTLAKLIDMSPEHVSFYSLQIEEGTRFYEDYRKEKLDALDDDLDRAMYHEGIKMLKNAGYRHYEISNAAKPGYECRHNIKYWRFQEYLGIGASSSSFIEGVRRTNAGDQYMKIMDDPEPVFRGVLTEDHENTGEDSMSEYMFTGLRMSDGIDLDDFRKRFGRDVFDVYSGEAGDIESFIASGHLKRDAGRLFLTEKGIDISNKIMQLFV